MRGGPPATGWLGAPRRPVESPMVMLSNGCSRLPTFAGLASCGGRRVTVAFELAGAETGRFVAHLEPGGGEAGVRR